MGIADVWMVIVNPKAGSGRGLKDWPVISNQMYQSGLHFTCLFTEHKYHAMELTVKAINDGYRNIVAVGGDGTIHTSVIPILLKTLSYANVIKTELFKKISYFCVLEFILWEKL